MQNYVQDGKVLTCTAPYAVASGAGFLVGSLFCVATSAAGNGATVEGMTCGVFALKKTAAQAWTQGAKIYWDNTAKECTTTVGSNTLIGVAAAAALGASATGNVKLGIVA